jgi:choline dehydrogenase-like flavoprotein
MADFSGFSYLRSLTDSAYDWSYKTVAQADAADLVKAWPRGKGLGGSGAVNGMYWNRGNRENYEAWKSESRPVKRPVDP